MSDLGLQHLTLRSAQVHQPSSMSELHQVIELHPEAVLLAGGTWIMRSPIRGDAAARHYIMLAGVPELHGIKTDSQVAMGAQSTLTQVHEVTRGLPSLRALAQAATSAATPSLRRVITLGGSLGAQDFTASDIAPALLCLDAEVIKEGLVICTIKVPVTDRVSWHERLTWRRGGEYSVATASVSANPDGTGVQVALGSVEAQPRRWHEVEEALGSEDVRQTPHIADVVRQFTHTLEPIDGPGIPAEYRREVIPVVLERAVRSLW